jgi:selenocysteine-specific elongation factor
LDAKTLSLSLSEIRKKIGETEEALKAVLSKLEETHKIIRITGHKEEKYLHKNYFEDLEDKSKTLVQEYLDNNPHRLTMPYQELRSKILELTDSLTLRAVMDGMVAKNILRRKDSDVILVGYESKLDPRHQRLLQTIEQEFIRKGFVAPVEEELRQKVGLHPKEFKNLMHNLFERGILVRLSDKVVYHKEAEEKARRIVLQYLEKYPSITVAELRDILKLSRKYATAILEYYDEIGLTKRDKDVHILR